MSTPFWPLPARFIGREAVSARFRARLAHFRFFLYAGIAGIGKTAQLLRLAEHCREAGMTGALYLPVHPGEGIGSLGARLACRLEGQQEAPRGSHADPYARLMDMLARHHQVLILDDLHHLRRDELTALIRLCQRAQAQSMSFRIIGGMRGDPELSAMDLGAVHFERLGALSADEVRSLAKSWHLTEAARDVAVADAKRGGALGQPLTANVMMALTGPKFVEKAALCAHTSRSVHAFKSLVQAVASHWDAQERQLLANLAQIAHPMARNVAESIFGPGVAHALKRGLIDVIADDIQVHSLLHELLPTGQVLSAEIAIAVAAHLRERADRQGEPHAYLAAAAVLWRAGDHEAAVETLAQAVRWTRDAGFVEAFLQGLKRLTHIEATALAPRLRLLVAEAQRHHTHASVVLAEMQELAQSADVWTRSRALAALAELYTELKAPEKTIEVLAQLEPLAPSAAVLVQAGMLAAEALVALSRQDEAEALIRRLLALTQPVADAVAAPLAALPSGQASDHASGHASGPSDPPKLEMAAAAETADGSPGARPVVARPGFVHAEGTLRRHLAEILAHSGRLDEALQEAMHAAECFAAVGDTYQAAMAHGFVGDLQRELGAFPEAKVAHAAFLQAANAAGDRDLAHIAQLADAWVALDIGDVAHAAKRVQAVKRELGAAPSRRLKRYLAAAEGLLEAGRGHHERAAMLLARVVDAWEAAGQRTIAGTLNAQLIRSLIACDRLDAAEAAVQSAMAGVDASTNSLFLASLKREQALIRLRRGEVDKAIEELAEARRLFAQAKNRREEALTLYRIGYAALDEGNVALAKEKAAETLTLATKIKHARARALARELMARIALLQNDPATALTHAKEAQQALRRLGDELGVLHVSETLTQALLGTGDLVSAIKLGARVSALAHQAGMRDLRVRMIVLTGIGLWRRDRLKSAARCFRPLPKRGHTAWTRVLMWRFGESLGLSQGAHKAAHQRRGHWVAVLADMPPARRAVAIQSLEQLNLTPRDRCVLRDGQTTTLLNTETLALADLKTHALCFDVPYRRVWIDGHSLELTAPSAKLLLRLAITPDAILAWEAVLTTLGQAKDGGATAGRRAMKDLSSGLSAHGKILELAATAQGVHLKVHVPYAIVLPIWLATQNMPAEQVAVLKLLRRRGTASIALIQETCGLGRAIAKREVTALALQKLIELVREGRGQVYRLT